MKKKTLKAKRMTKSRTLSRKANIKHCYSCRDGRLIRHNGLVFCGFCGKEFRPSVF